MDIRAPKLCKKVRLRQFASRFYPMMAQPVDSLRQVQTTLGKLQLATLSTSRWSATKMRRDWNAFITGAL